jgi:hypothetical protein
MMSILGCKAFYSIIQNREKLFPAPDVSESCVGRWQEKVKAADCGLFTTKKYADEIWLLAIYRKSEMDNIPTHVLRQIAEEIKNV